MATTRGKNTCEIYGLPSELPKNQLPTIGDVMRLYAYLQTKESRSRTCKSSEIVSEAALQVASLWNKAGIPIVSIRRVSQKIELLHNKLRDIKKKKGKSKLSAISLTKDEGLCLFDIAACHCVDINNCNCPRELKVPVLEKEFLCDQRESRKMTIGSVDKATTSELKKKSERASKRRKYYSDISSTKHFETVADFDIEIVSESETGDNTNDCAYELDADADASPQSSSTRNVIKIPTVARECDRYGVSDTAGAAIATATLIDYGIITSTDSTAVIDRSKLRRQREQVRKKLSKEAMSHMSSKEGIKALFFDGRKDKTSCSSLVNPACIIVEEHITLIEEPNSVFLGHVTPEGSSSKKKLSSIIDFFFDHDISLESLSAVGSDGTNVNTGINGGVIRLLELYVGRPLQWIICMLHCNELPLRHLLMHLDGSTSGPDTFSGTVGKALKNCQDLPVVNFEIRPNNLPELVRHNSDIKLNLSKDQKYLLDMCQAIEKGHLSESLSKKMPGPLVHSRWLTAANRILRLYVSTESPSPELTLLTDYILKVYAPIWFSIKLEPQCYKGAKHLWLMAKYSRFLPDSILPVVDTCIQRNGFFGHPENILLAMLADERKEIRELGSRRIKAARQSQRVACETITVRKFLVPQLNLNAEEYSDLIDWFECPRTEPPLLKKISDEDVDRAIESKCKWDLENIPCHSQAVERHVRIVSQASAAVCGELRRDGYIRAKLSSRKSIPKFVSKRYWTV